MSKWEMISCKDLINMISNEKCTKAVIDELTKLYFIKYKNSGNEK